MYFLNWKNPAFDVNKSTPIQVPVGSVVSNAASLRFTGKGAANYGAIQQENLMRLLENFADGAAPLYPTVGQIWYDTTNSIIRLCASTSPLVWKSIAGIQVTAIGEPAPSPAAVGDLWFSRTGSSSGILYVFTGLGRFPVTGNATYPNTGASVGGWEQVWPTVSIAAGREEYDYLFTLVNKLIGLGNGGNGAWGKGTPHLTDLVGLDESVQSKFITRLPLDGNVRSIEIDYVKKSTFEDGSLGTWNGGFVAPVANRPWTKALATSARDTVEQTNTLAAPGEIFYFKADLNAENTTAALSFGAEIHSADGNVVTWIPAASIAPGTGWSHLSGVVTMPAGTDHFVPWIQINSAPFQGGIGYATNLHITRVDLGELKVDPTSQDWDMLLASAKWAVNRLELPPNITQDISAVPFVTDGLPPHPTLLSMPLTDIRYPSPERRANRKFGLVTLVREFTETVNVLNAAIQNRYSLKGINGSSGTNQAFDPVVQVFTQQSFSGAANGSANGSIGLYFRFADAKALTSFINSGAAVQLQFSHVPGGAGTAGDTNLKALFDSRGFVRITADKVRVFANTIPATLSVAPAAAGLQNASYSVPATVITNQSYSGATYSINTLILDNGTKLGIGLVWSTTDPMNGTTSVTFSTIRDTTTYLAPAVTPVFGVPMPYTSSDKSVTPGTTYV